MGKFNKIKKIVLYILTLILVFIFFDFVVFDKMLNLGNEHYRTNLNGHPSKVDYPYVGFVPKKIAGAEPYSIYYSGNDIYKNNEDKIKIAFFGGSTGVLADFHKKGSLNIPKYLEKDLKAKLKKDVVVINYSCLGARHRQHLHMLLEFMPKFKPDIVVFYGGNNETTQTYGFFDPRQNYPFNYYYKYEFPKWKKFLLENSAIISNLDEKFHLYHPAPIRIRIHHASPKWIDENVEMYMETMDLSNKITKTFKSDLLGECAFVGIFQPLNIETEKSPESKENTYVLIGKIRKEISHTDYLYDFYNKFDKFSPDTWYDICHVKDKANQYMAEEIADLLIDKYLKKYKK